MWKVAGASIVGPSHLAEGGDCQDAHSITLDTTGGLVAVVSDGAGSSASGGIAAQLICEELSPLLLETLRLAGEKPFSDRTCRARMRRRLPGAVSKMRSGLLNLASEQGIHPDELLATLVGVIAHPCLGAAFLHIGDGAGICFDPAGETLIFSPPENGEYINTTYFVIEEDWRTHLRLSFVPPGFRTIFLMSDGVTDLAFTRDAKGMTPFKSFFEPLGRFLGACGRAEGEAALADSLGSEAARLKVDDDKTLVWLEFDQANA